LAKNIKKNKGDWAGWAQAFSFLFYFIRFLVYFFGLGPAQLMWLGWTQQV